MTQMSATNASTEMIYIMFVKVFNQDKICALAGFRDGAGVKGSFERPDFGDSTEMTFRNRLWQSQLHSLSCFGYQG